MFIRSAIKMPDSPGYKAAIVLVAIGLDVFIKFNHCMNACYKAAEYDDKKDEIRVLSYGKAHRDVFDLCLTMHDKIQGLLGIDDIRLFDKILQAASNNKCSLIHAHGGGVPLTIHELRKRCRERKISYSGLSKDELVLALH